MDKPTPPKNDPKTTFGWCMYDWANSAYVTTVAVGLLPVYFASVIVGPEGLEIGGSTYRASTLWAAAIGIAALITFLVAPLLGAVADYANAKKRFLLSFAYTGALFTLLLFFSDSGDVWQTMVLFVAAQVCFIGANVFYDAFLPQIATDDQMDLVSGKGFSYGYIGGGLQLALAFALVALHEQFGISQTMAVRIGILGAALWWAGFTVFTAKNLIEGDQASPFPDLQDRSRFPVAAYACVGFRRLLETTRRVGRFKHLVLFLFSYMLYNDGIQTVINLATIYGKEELNLSTTVLLVTLLVIQLVASVGALLFSRMALFFGTKRTVMLSLVLWSLVVAYAYFMETTAQFFAVGVIVGLVLGGSQALSRSFYGSMIPEEASAEFYGFYTVFSKFSAIWGPFVFAGINQMTGSARNSILSIIIFFVAGLLLLYFVDEKKAREARYSVHLATPKKI